MKRNDAAYDVIDAGLVYVKRIPYNTLLTAYNCRLHSFSIKTLDFAVNERLFIKIASV